MRRYGGTSRCRAKHCHFLEGFTFDFHPLPHKRQEEMSAQLLGCPHLQERIQEFVEALVVYVLKQIPASETFQWGHLKEYFCVMQGVYLLKTSTHICGGMWEFWKKQKYKIWDGIPLDYLLNISEVSRRDITRQTGDLCY